MARRLKHDSDSIVRSGPGGHCEFACLDGAAFWRADRGTHEQLLSNALRDLSLDPSRLGSSARPELGDGVRIYHLRHSRKLSDIVRPRHLILYRIPVGLIVEVGRVLHDAMELGRHVVFDFRPEP